MGSYCASTCGGRGYCVIECMVFNAVFNSISVLSRRPVHLSMLSCSSLTSTLHNILSNIVISKTMDISERRMNPAAMTIINPRKEYWPSRGSNQRLPVFKSATLTTELWGSSASCVAQW